MQSRVGQQGLREVGGPSGAGVGGSGHRGRLGVGQRLHRRRSGSPQPQLQSAACNACGPGLKKVFQVVVAMVLMRSFTSGLGLTMHQFDAPETLKNLTVLQCHGLSKRSV